MRGKKNNTHHGRIPAGMAMSGNPRLLRILRAVRRGSMSPAAGVRSLQWLPVEDLGFARLDTHRELRTRVPEVVFCQGKAPSHSLAIIKRLVKINGRVLATRAPEELFQRVREAGVPAEYDESSRVLRAGRKKIRPKGLVGVLCAGTADIPVAEEAAKTAEFVGANVKRSYDVGVAGLHRLLRAKHLIAKADALVVAAGMEGALPSVVGGLAEAPVIAVPTSVGYGANFRGVAPLLAMINSCAPGIAVVNIDNGFGGGYLAAIIARRRHKG